MVPYIDQPLGFWYQLRDDLRREIREVYLPLPPHLIGSGRPPHPLFYANDFLNSGVFRVNVLVNPVILTEPVDLLAPRIIETLRRWQEEFGIVGATVSNLLLASRIREAIPGLRLCASTLMDIATPAQALMINGICDAVVPATRVMRNLAALRELRSAFRGNMRLLVNEGCLPGCPHRTQHFYEMALGIPGPKTFCKEMLDREPWLRLTGAWVLPQHLHLFEGVYDELKLAGRLNLRDPERFRRVLDAYISRSELQPHEIGCGPASPEEPIDIPESFYSHTLHCGNACHACEACRKLLQP